MKGGYIFYPNTGMPKKAKWLAVHSDGRVHLFAKKPSKDRSGYWQMKLPGYNEPADLLPGIFKAGMLYRLVPIEKLPPSKRNPIKINCVGKDDSVYV